MSHHTNRRAVLKAAGGVLAGAAYATGTGAAKKSGNGNRTIGGGEGYNRTIPPSEADYMISDASDLRPVLEDDAESGDVVYIDPDETLVVSDIGRSYADNIPVPEGVTLASNRGIDGEPGGHIKNELNTWPTFDINEDVRVTGLRLSGPNWDWFEYDADKSGMGIRAVGPNTEVDNCELFGFSHAAIGKGHPSFYGQFSLNVHNNHIHHNPMDALGYGVASTYGGHSIIEYNHFENNRHAIAGGSGEGGYTARFNHVTGETLGHHFDMHRPGGERIHIHHNTFESVQNAWEDHPEQGVSIRGVPNDEAWIHHNWFHNPREPLDCEEMDEDEWTEEAITQAHVDCWDSVRFKHNHYGSSEPKNPSIGAPISE